MVDGFRGLPNVGATPREIAEAVNRLTQGKLNSVISVTLTANQGSTTVSSPLLTGSSWLGFMPKTANAAAEIGAGTLYVSSRGKETATLTHANNAQTDRDFDVLIIG